METPNKEFHTHRCSEIERVLVETRGSLLTALNNLRYVNPERSLHEQGYSIIGMPDWQARQLVDKINAALAMKDE